MNGTYSGTYKTSGDMSCIVNIPFEISVSAISDSSIVAFGSVDSFEIDGQYTIVGYTSVDMSFEGSDYGKVCGHSLGSGKFSYLNFEKETNKISIKEYYLSGGSVPHTYQLGSVHFYGFKSN